MLAVALLLQTVEFLQLRNAFRDDAVFAWPALRAEHASLPKPVRWIFALLLPYTAFTALLFVRLALAFALLAGMTLAAPLLLFSQVAIFVRFRGTFNGGSDYMTVLVLTGLTLARAFRAYPLAATASYLYVAVQLVFSYFLAGLVKLRQPAWRHGTALASFTSDARFASPRWARVLFRKPALGPLACWSVIAFECSFPLALLEPRATVVYAVFGAAFHLFNHLVFGLNRFLFAWSAAYPALFLASRLQHG